jgi:hypothetical protein
VKSIKDSAKASRASCASRALTRPTTVALAVTAFFVSIGSAHAVDMTVRVTIPTLNVAESHRPYVAMWIERPDQTVAANLAVWYDLKKKNNEGEKWLKDMRQWWRRSGRDLQMPVDGVSGATRPVGEQKVSFVSGKAQLPELPPGDYVLMVEAAREAGGHELVKVPFQWPPKTVQNDQAQGQSELGAVALELKP